MVPTLQVPQEGCWEDPIIHVVFRPVTSAQQACANVSCSHHDREDDDGASFK